MQNMYYAAGSDDFLGMRKSRRGPMEIVYDDGAARRMVWQVTPQLGADDTVLRDISEAMRVAVAAQHILPTLYNELKNRAVGIVRL